MSDLLLERLHRTQAERARLEAQHVADRVRVELARSNRIEQMRREADERHRRERRQITAAAGHVDVALVRRVRDARAAGSSVEQRRREQLQNLADEYAAFHGDTAETQAARRDALDAATRPAEKTSR